MATIVESPLYHNLPRENSLSLLSRQLFKILFAPQPRRDTLPNLLLVLTNAYLQILEQAINGYLNTLRSPYEPSGEKLCIQISLFSKLEDSADILLKKAIALNRQGFICIRNRLRRWMGPEKCPVTKRYPTKIVYGAARIYLENLLSGSIIIALATETMASSAGAAWKSIADTFEGEDLGTIMVLLFYLGLLGASGIINVLSKDLQAILNSGQKVLMMKKIITGLIDEARGRVQSSRRAYDKMVASYRLRKHIILQSIQGRGFQTAD